MPGPFSCNARFLPPPAIIEPPPPIVIVATTATLIHTTHFGFHFSTLRQSPHRRPLDTRAHSLSSTAPRGGPPATVPLERWRFLYWFWRSRAKQSYMGASGVSRILHRQASLRQGQRGTPSRRHTFLRHERLAPRPPSASSQSPPSAAPPFSRPPSGPSITSSSSLAEPASASARVLLEPAWRLGRARARPLGRTLRRLLACTPGAASVSPIWSAASTGQALSSLMPVGSEARWKPVRPYDTGSTLINPDPRSALMKAARASRPANDTFVTLGSPAECMAGGWRSLQVRFAHTGPRTLLPPPAKLPKRESRPLPKRGAVGCEGTARGADGPAKAPRGADESSSWQPLMHAATVLPLKPQARSGSDKASRWSLGLRSQAPSYASSCIGEVAAPGACLPRPSSSILVQHSASMKGDQPLQSSLLSALQESAAPLGRPRAAPGVVAGAAGTGPQALSSTPPRAIGSTDDRFAMRWLEDEERPATLAAAPAEGGTMLDGPVAAATDAADAAAVSLEAAAIASSKQRGGIEAGEGADM
ncbi:hypothetical protein TSOC_001709 [Tetrabaena socialis]|uniref:Uncharacterized protein n=1 Tax=Tetrabaena socialis TaxID=47790 RepID=A0A2J8AFY5_9CHLO|nr:hypothetical protein TSOC_001709 [Tetrabaena socialis]|eukprot:PNH11435.1 hypothetical protein TSOC_001709 [Tetrabaena socialis]